MNKIEQQIFDELSSHSFTDHLLYNNIDSDNNMPLEDRESLIKSHLASESKLQELKEKYPAEYQRAERWFDSRFDH